MISLGLIGYPLEHSLSPKIHKAALDFCGLKGKYSLFPILPDDLHGLRDQLDRIRSGEITGLNVTIPHKQSIIPLLDVLTETAQAVGAVNTVYLENGKLTADNTDVPGFLADLYKFIDAGNDKLGDTKKALVLGAGGAARAVVYSLINDGWAVVLAARRLEQTQALIAQFPDKKSQLTRIEFKPDAFPNQDSDLYLVVNTTPVGMSPNIENSPWPLGVNFPPQAAFYDLVYKPHETKYVHDARAAGLQAVTGMGMLVEQAALAFETWTGYNVPRETLFSAVEEK